MTIRKENETIPEYTARIYSGSLIREDGTLDEKLLLVAMDYCEREVRAQVSRNAFFLANALAHGDDVEKEYRRMAHAEAKAERESN